MITVLIKPYRLDKVPAALRCTDILTPESLDISTHSTAFWRGNGGGVLKDGGGPENGQGVSLDT